MTWVLWYLAIGMVYSTISAYPIFRKYAIQNQSNIVNTFLATILVICTVTPFWIFFLIFGVCSLFYKGRK